MPTARALRHALATTLGVAPWAIFNAVRHLTKLNVLDDGVTARAASLTLLAVLASSPHQHGRTRFDIDRGAYILRRVQALANLRPRFREVRGGLPICFQIFAQDNLPLCVALEVLIEQTTSEHVFRYLVDDKNEGPFDSILFDIHAPGSNSRVAFTLRTNNGSTLEVTFGEPGDILAPSPAALTMRLGLDARAIIELSRLVNGDASAEARVAEALPQEPARMVPPSVLTVVPTESVPAGRGVRTRRNGDRHFPDGRVVRSRETKED